MRPVTSASSSTTPYSAHSPPRALSSATLASIAVASSPAIAGPVQSPHDGGGTVTLASNGNTGDAATGRGAVAGAGLPAHAIPLPITSAKVAASTALRIIVAHHQRPKTEDRRPKTEDRRPKTEDRRPKTEDRRPMSAVTVGLSFRLVSSAGRLPRSLVAGPRSRSGLRSSVFGPRSSVLGLRSSVFGLRSSLFHPVPPNRPTLMTKAGTVTVAGRPNAGKSTLLNRLVGQRLAITSPKPQSTRERVVGLVTRRHHAKSSSSTHPASSSRLTRSSNPCANPHSRRSRTPT